MSFENIIVTTFDIGELLCTCGIANAIRINPSYEAEIINAFIRYCNRDWSDMEYEEDKKRNDEAIASGETRILASYKTSEGEIYIITEWDRSYTTIMFADEY